MDPGTPNKGVTKTSPTAKESPLERRVRMSIKDGLIFLYGVPWQLVPLQDGVIVLKDGDERLATRMYIDGHFLELKMVVGGLSAAAIFAYAAAMVAEAARLSLPSVIASDLKYGRLICRHCGKTYRLNAHITTHLIRVHGDRREREEIENEALNAVLWRNQREKAY
jgi:hypothetical protein